MSNPNNQGNWHGDMREGHRARADIYWWTRKPSQKNAALQALINDFQLVTQDNQRLEAYETYASLYQNRRIDPGAPLLANYEAGWAMKKGKYSRVPYNLLKVVVDEAGSRITKTHPYAKFMTHGGNRSMQRKAEMLERWNNGEVERMRQDELFDQVIKDACLYGLGALKHMKAYRENRVETIRVYPGNLFVDLEETLFEKPRRLHHRRFVSKTVLTAMFPRYREQIMDSDSVSEDARFTSWYGHYLGAQDMVELVESWHLPSYLDEGKPSSDGIRFLWIQKAVLQASPYVRREFPFSFFNWKTDPHNTFYGTGLGEDLTGVHIDANVTINRINTAIENIALPHVLVKKGSKVSKASIQNAAGSIYEYTGNEPPQVVLPQTVAGDLLQYIREHEQRAYRIAGLSNAAAAGEATPPGLQTGAAVNTYFQVESVPFNQQLRKFENFVKHIAINNVAVGKEIYEHDSTYSVVLPGDKNTIQQVKWADVSMDMSEQESYVIRVAPTSSLSETAAARIAEVEKLQMMGIVTDPAVARDLVNLSDLEKEDDMVTAAKKNIDRMIALAIDKNVFSPPTPTMDLQLFKIRATAEEQRAEDYENVPEENIATLRRMIRRAEELIQKQQVAALAQQQGMVTPTVPAQQPNTGQQPTALQGV